MLHIVREYSMQIIPLLPLSAFLLLQDFHAFHDLFTLYQKNEFLEREFELRRKVNFHNPR